MKCNRSLRFARVAAISCWASMISIVVILSSSDVRAEVHVSGSKAAVVVDAKNASLEEIIAALNATLNVQISFAPATTIPAITGTYSGSLRRVLARMLNGQDFILNSSGDRIAVIVTTRAGIGSVRRTAANSSPSLPPANNSIAAITDEEPHSPGILGWDGGFSAPPAAK
jgi:hypothetical protein